VGPQRLLAVLDDAAVAVRRALDRLDLEHRRERTGVPGQYLLDVEADTAAVPVLLAAGLRVLSEESGLAGDPAAAHTVVIDPVDGSTNCARGIAYYATSMCVLDADGPLVALVVNQATGSRTTAARGAGAFRDGVRLRASNVARVEESVVGLSGIPSTILPWRQLRTLGSVALALCDVAAGGLDGYVDLGAWHAPWDYLGATLACSESGAHLVDVRGEPLAVVDASARRQLLAAGTPELLDALRPAAEARG
jgi:fructose-1,6-bisphosphatase/inositol monophosphatase family enzyme